MRYEFYQIPDSIELWREGKKIGKIGPKSGSGSIPVSDPVLHGSGYVGVKVIGNPTDKRTLWNYTIQCNGQPPCDDEDIQNEYDKNDKNYHYHVVQSKICPLSIKGCTQERIFEIMMSQENFMTPQPFRNTPVKNCEVNILTGTTSDGNPIKTEIYPSSYSAVNYTLPGHMFYPGRVTRSVVVMDDAIGVETIGEGTGDYRWLNNWLGPEIWKGADSRLLFKVKLILDYENLQ